MKTETIVKPYSRRPSKKRSRESQESRVLKLLKLKSIVTLTEIMNLRIASHTKIISNLREKGWVIENYIRTQEGIKLSVYGLKGKR